MPIQFSIIRRCLPSISPRSRLGASYDDSAVSLWLAEDLITWRGGLLRDHAFDVYRSVIFVYCNVFYDNDIMIKYMCGLLGTI